MSAPWLLSRLRPARDLPPVESLPDWELDLISLGTTERQMAAYQERQRRRRERVVTMEWAVVQKEGFGL